jgi:hypothetical protein
MPFGRTGKHNNRSQHNLVGATVGGASASSQAQSDAVSAASTPPPASSNTAFSSSESFDTSSRSTQPQSQPSHPPQHSVNIYNSAQGGGNGNGNGNGGDLVSQLHHSNTISGGAFDSRRRDPEFADLVSRSQSQRFPGQLSPIQTQQQQQQQQQQQLQQQQQQYGIATGSVDNLHDTVNINSPGAHQQGPPLHQQLPTGPPPKKQSTRKLIKNILTGSNNRGADPHQHTPQNSSSYNNTGGLARRPSKRVSNLPPAIPTGVSQVSLEQHPLDWQPQGAPIVPSPLQPVGEFRDSYLFTDSNQESLLQNPQDFQQQQLNTSIRPVPADVDRSPYSADEVGAYHQQQGHIQLQGATPELQQQQFTQAAFDQQQQQQQQAQYQYASSQQTQYQSDSRQLFPGHQQNPETISQLSHESPVTDSDQLSVTNVQTSQTSPAVNHPPQPHTLQTQDIPERNPGRQNQTPSSAQPFDPSQNTQQQTMAPPPGGPPPNRRSQENEKAGLGPPPSYRHSQQPPNMNNPLPPPPPSAGIQPPSNYRQSSSLQERPPYEGQVAEGRNSPQPSASGDGSEDKALKELRESQETGRNRHMELTICSDQVQEREATVL